MAGLATDADCPECGLRRCLMSEGRLPRGVGVGNALERLGIALLPAGVTAAVAVTITLCMRPMSDVPLVATAAVLPCGFIALTAGGLYRRSRRAAMVKAIGVHSSIMGSLLGILMIAYWARWYDWGDDFLWPITDIVFFGAVQVVAGMVTTMVLIMIRTAELLTSE